MQKIILSAVLSLFLVASASSAFAEGYWQQQQQPLLDLDRSFNHDSFNTEFDIDLDINKTMVKQGNYVSGHIVIQQFGESGSYSGLGGNWMVVDNSINDSYVGSYNTVDSYNTRRTSTRTSTRTKTINVDIEIDDSFNFNNNRLRLGHGGLRNGQLN